MNDYINQNGNGNTANIIYNVDKSQNHTINYNDIKKEPYSLRKWYIAMLVEGLAALASILGIISTLKFDIPQFTSTYGNQKYNFSPLIVTAILLIVLAYLIMIFSYQVRKIIVIHKNRFIATNFTKSGLMYDKKNKRYYKIDLPLCPICQSKTHISSNEGFINISCSVNPKQHTFEFDYTKML